jgi:hypothetical protein
MILKKTKHYYQQTHTWSVPQYYNITIPNFDQYVKAIIYT